MKAFFFPVPNLLTHSLLEHQNVAHKTAHTLDSAQKRHVLGALLRMNITITPRHMRNDQKIYHTFEWGKKLVSEMTTTGKAGATTPFYSTAGGSITELDVKEGATIVKLANLSTVWIEAPVAPICCKANIFSGTAPIPWKAWI